MRRRGIENAALPRFRKSSRVKKNFRAPRLSKAEMRAQTAALVEQWQIQKAPTRLDLECPRCGQCASVTIELKPGLKFRCSRCGLRDPIIAGCNQLRRWSTSRR
jgi:predicted RNA-binding Zn-ribbon protein involved in translation (DUF1610 family)